MFPAFIVLVPARGLEPRFTTSKADVLPLDEAGLAAAVATTLRVEIERSIQLSYAKEGSPSPLSSAHLPCPLDWSCERTEAASAFTSSGVGLYPLRTRAAREDSLADDCLVLMTWYPTQDSNPDRAASKAAASTNWASGADWCARSDSNWHFAGFEAAVSTDWTTRARRYRERKRSWWGAGELNPSSPPVNFADSGFTDHPRESAPC